MSRIIDADFSQQWVFPPSLDDLLPPDHPARFVRDLVDQLDMRQLGFKVPRTTSAGGNAFSPRLLLRVWLYGWLVRVRTLRKLETACKNDIAMLWLTGLNAPDHNTLGRFWKDNKSTIKALFRQSVQVAAGMGLVSMVLHAVDGTKIRAASSRRTALFKRDIEALLEQVDAAIAQMEAEISQEIDSGQPFALPESLIDAKNRREEIAKQLQLLGERNQMHPAEPEVEMIRSGGVTAFNYNAQAVVDSASGIIVAEDVVTDATDNFVLVKMLEQVETNTAQLDDVHCGRAEHTLADGGYGGQRQIDQAAKGGWNVTAPVTERGELDNPLHPHHFRHDSEKDCLVCPLTGQELPYKTTHKERKGHLEARVYRCPVTKTCPFGKECAGKSRYRQVEVTKERPNVLLQVEKHKDGRMGQAMRQRLGLIEGIFAWIKQQLGMRRFSVLDLNDVRAQWSLTCLISNLAKMIRSWQATVRQNSPSNFINVPNQSQQVQIYGNSEKTPLYAIGELLQFVCKARRKMLF